MGTPHSAIARHFISTEVCKELTNAGLPHNHPIRQELEKEAVIVGDRDAFVRIPDGHGGTMMLSARIDQLKVDPRFAATFPTDPPKVAKTDTRNLSEHFDEIAAGTVIVGE
jgi:F420-0:gamma-glutamyl ligase